MVGTIRDSLNQAPPWVSYAIVGVVLAAAVGLVAWQLAEPSASGDTGDKHFYCADCDDGFTVTQDDARELLRQAAKANPGTRPLAKCKKCGKYTCVVGKKCPKCNAYYSMPDKGTESFVGVWRDECPKCEYSGQRERAVRAALRQKKEGKYDPDKTPEFIRNAVEDAEESGEFKDE